MLESLEINWQMRLPIQEQHFTLPPAKVPSPLTPVIAKLRHTCYSTWSEISLSQISLLPSFVFSFNSGSVAQLVERQASNR